MVDSFSLAVLSDIHGNRWALEAVLEDLARSPADVTVNLGDSLWGPLDPAGTAEMLMPIAMRSVRGNTDRDLLSQPSESPSATEKHSRSALTDERRAWLERHEPPFIFDGILACHGTPKSDLVTLLEDVTETGVRRRNGEQIGVLLASQPSEVTLVLCGHSHVPGIVQAANGPLVVNPGSIGLPAYRADVPHAHCMESGSPHARYAVIRRVGDSWRIELRSVVYDWEAAAMRARAIGRTDWAYALRTGHAAS
jgi:predicted phosphodiesterase